MKSYVMLNILKNLTTAVLILTPKTDGFFYICVSDSVASKFPSYLGSRYHSNKNHKQVNDKEW